MQTDNCGTIRCDCFCFIFEVANVDVPTINTYFHKPFIASFDPAHTLRPRRVVLANGHVAKVLPTRCYPQICNTIVGPASIDVVDVKIVGGPLSMHKRPR